MKQPSARTSRQPKAPTTPSEGDFKLGQSRYQVALRYDEPAQGAPHVQLCVLTDRKSHKLAEAIIQWAVDVERATGPSIIISVSGDNEDSGADYKSLRTESLSGVDLRSSQKYRSELRRRVPTRMTELSVNSATSISIAAQFGIDQSQLPCIAWRTFPNIEPTVTIPIRDDWYLNDESVIRWIRAFIRWFDAGHLKRSTKKGMTVGSLRRVISRLSKNLAEELGRGVSGQRLKRIADTRVIAHLKLTARTEESLRSTRPARLEFIPPRDAMSPFVSRTQLFYLSAFSLHGQSARTSKGIEIRVLESILVDRLKRWTAANLRAKRTASEQKSEHQIAKDWARFAKNMNDRLGSDEWFNEHVNSGDRRKRYFSCSTESVILKLESQDRRFLREMLVKLTGLA